MASVNVIGGTDYLAIAEFYSDARTANLNSIGKLYDAVYRVVVSEEIFPTLDLINPFWSSYIANSNTFRSAVNYASAVNALNTHVITRAGLNAQLDAITSLDMYLEDQNIQVPMGWAELSKVGGNIICRDHIYDLPLATTVDGTTGPRFADGTIIPVC
jgi:hypothetical protein